MSLIYGHEKGLNQLYFVSLNLYICYIRLANFDNINLNTYYLYVYKLSISLA